MKIKLNNLRLYGDNKDYIIDFKDGLNFITGPISTGKSTILELIDYCLGKKRHKNYDEVRATCKYVCLDLLINNKRFLIERPLFLYQLPVKVFDWNEEQNSFNVNFNYFQVTNPKEEDSFTKFILEELKIPEIKLSGQILSFRDIFKYCYISQTKIDSENILDEKNYTQAFKRKPTLEIIFNSLNELLNELKNKRKEQNNIITELLNKKESIIKFLNSVELYSTETDNTNKKVLLINKRNETLTELTNLKIKGKHNSNNTQKLEEELFVNRNKIRKFKIEIDEINKYLEKLNLLRNQYSNEIIKIDYLILSNGKLRKVEFTSCPSCSGDIQPQKENKCGLCGQEISEFSKDEEKAIKNERKRINTKLNSLIRFIEEQRILLAKTSRLKTQTINENKLKEEKINSIQQEYISPFIEKIEILNREVGEIDKQIENIELNVNVQKELSILSNEIQIQENLLNDTIVDIKYLEEENINFDSIIDQLSKSFYKTLKAFNFPKLSNAYIDQKTYLPYVRGTKYDQIGSLGAVTLVNIAYFMSILETSIKLKKSYHPSIIMLDTIGKNLGTRVNNPDELDEFKDSIIFKSVVNYLVEFSLKYKDKVQIIVINNDYTESIKESDIIAHFDGNGNGELPYGLIDDFK